MKDFFFPECLMGYNPRRQCPDLWTTKAFSPASFIPTPHPEETSDTLFSILLYPLPHAVQLQQPLACHLHSPHLATPVTERAPCPASGAPWQYAVVTYAATEVALLPGTKSSRSYVIVSLPFSIYPELLSIERQPLVPRPQYSTSTGEP